MNRRDFLRSGVAVSGLAIVNGHPGAVQRKRASAARTAADAFETVAAVVEEQMQLLHIPGAALGVLKDGRIALRGFGVTNVENPQPVDEHTIFNLASISKTVTATAVMSLVEQGKLDLDGLVRTWIPDWRVGDEESSRTMRLRHLLTHSTGLNGTAATQDVGVEMLARFAQSMTGLKRIAPPGAVFSYLNPGFALAGRIIELATATDIHRALRQLVFGPLGLQGASTRLDEIATRRLAVGHRPGNNGAVAVIRPFSMGTSPTAGGVSMGIADLMRYTAFHLNEGETGRVSILTTAGRERMRQPQLAKAPTADTMGIGWHLRSVGGMMTVAHGGTAGAGHRLLLELVPERRLAFAILTNHTEGWRLNQRVERELLKAYEGVELARNQRTAYRGINEDLSLRASPLDAQPDLAQYIGSYDRGTAEPLVVKSVSGRIVADTTPLTFYGPDVAFSLVNGTPTEFIRNESGAVTWIRQNGQDFARKQRV